MSSSTRGINNGLARLKPQAEKAEQAAIVMLLERLGAKIWVLGTRRPKGDYPGTRQTPGLPDLLVCLPRCARLGWRMTRLEIEVKTKQGRTSDAQLEYQALCRATGISHILGGLDDVLAWLRARGYVR